MDWPPLQKSGYIAGRSATVDDVKRGDAIFTQQTNVSGERAEPLDIQLPQYAIWRAEDGSDIRAILIQAELHITNPGDEPIFGLRTLDGAEVVAIGSEVTLLGNLLERKG